MNMLWYFPGWLTWPGSKLRKKWPGFSRKVDKYLSLWWNSSTMTVVTPVLGSYGSIGTQQQLQSFQCSSKLQLSKDLHQQKYSTNGTIISSNSGTSQKLGSNQKWKPLNLHQLDSSFFRSSSTVKTDYKIILFCESTQEIRKMYLLIFLPKYRVSKTIFCKKKRYWTPCNEWFCYYFFSLAPSAHLLDGEKMWGKQRKKVDMMSLTFFAPSWDSLLVPSRVSKSI